MKMLVVLCMFATLSLVNDRVEGQASTTVATAAGGSSHAAGGGGPSTGGGGPATGGGGSVGGGGGPAAGGGGNGTGNGGGGSGALPVVTASGHWIVLLILSLVFSMMQ